MLALLDLALLAPLLLALPRAGVPLLVFKSRMVERTRLRSRGDGPVGRLTGGRAGWARMYRVIAHTHAPVPNIKTLCLLRFAATLIASCAQFIYARNHVNPALPTGNVRKAHLDEAMSLPPKPTLLADFKALQLHCTAHGMASGPSPPARTC